MTAGAGWLRQGLRFAAVGIASNFSLYIVYLALAAGALGTKSAMTVAYILAVLLTFAANRRWTFATGHPRGAVLRRYCAVYGLGYALNWIGLHVLYDRLGWPHEIVQAGLIIIIAVLSFILQRNWVFRARQENPSPDRT